MFDPAASYKIINRKSISALSIKDAGSHNGALAILFQFVNAEDQFWHIVDIGNGFFKIVNNHSGRALSTLNGGSDDGAIVHVWDYLTTFPDQHWAINPVGDGFYKITNQNSGKAMSCLDGGMADDTPIQLWSVPDGFDDQDWSLVEVTQSVEVNAESVIVDPISRFMTGVGMEDINHEIYGGIYSQLIFGESFQEPPPASDPAGVSGMWTRIIKGSATGSVVIDTVNPFQGSQSQKITFNGGDGEIGVANQSLNRWGMNLLAARPYEGYVYLRASVLAQVYLAFESQGGDTVYEEISVTASGQNWTRHNFILTPNASDPHGRFAIKLKQSGSVDVGHVFIQPGDWGRFNGLPVRKDIADGLVAQGNTVLRFGGSVANSSDYRWNNMIGPRAIRPATSGTWYRYESNGWGIFDFLNFAESAGMVGIPAVNIDETPEAMSDFMDYVNGEGFNFWELQRRADGHPEPYHLKYLELGNEELVDMDYYNKFRRLATVIWAKDPEIILIVADYAYDHVIEDPFNFVGATHIKDHYDGRSLTTLAAHQQILNLAHLNKREVWIDCHVWTDNIDAKVGEQVAALHSLYTNLRTISPLANFKLVVLELNAFRHDLDRALANALAIGMMQRLCNEIVVVTSANALQPDGQIDNKPWDQGLLFFNQSRIWAQPAYYVTQMKSRNYLPIGVQANVSGRESVTFDVTVTTNADRSTLTLHVVNTIDVARTYSINLNGFNPVQETARVTTLTGAPGSQNSSTNPVAIVPSQADIPYTRIGNSITFTFAPSSFTILTLQPIGKKVLWHNALTDETQAWFINGERIKRRATVVDENGAAIFVGPPWRIVGTTDMTKEGQADIVWHNRLTDATQIWFMNGERIKRRATVLDENGAAIFVGPPWRIVGTGDMDGDEQADIVWHNSFTDATQIWFMNGERIKRRATVVDENGAAIPIGPPWRIAGTGDMDGDGQVDIIWHNGFTDETQIWFMNGERIKRRATVLDENGAAIPIGPPWRIVGTTDMTKDGQADIVWYNGFTDETQIWFMNGERIRRRATVVDENGAAIPIGPPWRIVGAGDLYGDASSDILWHNSQTNDIQFWFMNGPQIKGRNGVIDEHGLIIQVGDPWQIVGVTGLASETAILWHNSETNDIQFWFMNGPQIKGRNAVTDEHGLIIQVGAPWHIVGATGLTGETAILWHNSETNDIQFWFMNGPQIKGRNAVTDEHGLIIQVGAPWQIVGVTGLASETAILWHNSETNDIQFWFMNGPQIKGRNAVTDEHGLIIQVGAPWHIVEVTGLASETAILWHNSETNDIQFWFMNGPQIKGRNAVTDEHGLIIQVGDPWHIVGSQGA